jgi:TPP-dependent pyruvate/acetoin dehydrogenase alpha subunit
MRDGGYRSREEVEAWRGRDPIKRFREDLLRREVTGSAELDGVDREIQSLVDEALEWARSSPWPDPSTVLDHVFAETAAMEAPRA